MKKISPGASDERPSRPYQAAPTRNTDNPKKALSIISVLTVILILAYAPLNAVGSNLSEQKNNPNIKSSVNSRGVGSMSVVIPVKPVVFPFKRQVSSMYVIYRPNSIGLDSEGKISILSLEKSKISEQVIPPSVREGGLVKALIQDNPKLLYIIQRRFIYLLDIDKKKVLAEAPAYLETLNYDYEDGTVCDAERRIVMALYSYNASEQSLESSYEIRLESLVSGNTLKKKFVEYDNPGGIAAMHVFGSEHFFCRASADNPWLAFDANLDTVEHPFSNILNSSALLIGAINKVTLNEKAGTAACIGLSEGKQNLTLIVWKDGEKAEAVTVPFSQENNMQPSDKPFSSRFSISPSGKWLFVPACDQSGNEQSFLVRINTKDKPGFLPPFSLGFDGAVSHCTWITQPEGLVVNIENRLIYWDLSSYNQ